MATKAIQVKEPVAVEMKPVALLVATPQQLTEQHGIEFTEDTDDLGRFVWARVDVDDEPFVLMSYLDPADKRALLYGTDSAEPFCAAFGLADAWRPE